MAATPQRDSLARLMQLPPELALLCAIVRQLLHDVRSTRAHVRAEARQFLQDTEALAWWDDVLGLGEHLLRSRRGPRGAGHGGGMTTDDAPEREASSPDATLRRWLESLVAKTCRGGGRAGRHRGVASLPRVARGACTPRGRKRRHRLSPLCPPLVFIEL